MAQKVQCADSVVLTFVDADLNLNLTLKECVDCAGAADDEPIPVPFSSALLRRVQMFTTMRAMQAPGRNKWDPLSVLELRVLGRTLQERVDLCNVANYLNNPGLLQLAAKGIAQLNI